jgi:integrase
MSRATVDAYAIRFHGLHHTCASIIGTTGVEPEYAQERLCHADISVTRDTYAHVLPDKRAQVAKKIEEAIV